MRLAVASGGAGSEGGGVICYTQRPHYAASIKRWKCKQEPPSYPATLPASGVAVAAAALVVVATVTPPRTPDSESSMAGKKMIKTNTSQKCSSGHIKDIKRAASQKGDSDTTPRPKPDGDRV